MSSQKVEYVVVNCQECLNQRHLLSKIFARCVSVHKQEEDLDRYDRVDSINALASNLRRLLHKRTEKLVVVVVGVDQQRGATATLLPALARLGNLVGVLRLVQVDRQDLANKKVGPVFFSNSDVELASTFGLAQGWRAIHPLSALHAD